MPLRRVATPEEREQAKEVLGQTLNYLRNNLFGEKGGPYPEDVRGMIDYLRFAEKSKVVDSPINWMIGEIQGLSPKAAKAVRKLMQAEKALRGVPPRLFEASTAKASLSEDPISKALRGTFYHGRTTLPEGALTKEGKLGTRVLSVDEAPRIIKYEKVGSGEIKKIGTESKSVDVIPRRPDLRGARGKKLNIGEPTGISLSYSPIVGHKFSKRPGNELARVLPLYGGPPEDVILNAFDSKGGKVLKEAYLKAAKKTLSEYHPTGKLGKEAKETYFGITSNEAFKNYIDKSGLRTQFNENLTQFLQKKGYKGILYSPHRFDEYELKMFDPQDVLVVDRRKMLPDTSNAINKFQKQYADGLITNKELNERLAGLNFIKPNEPFSRMGFTASGSYVGGSTKTMEAMEDITEATGKHSLRDWYSELDVAKELGLRKTPAGGSSVSPTGAKLPLKPKTAAQELQDVLGEDDWEIDEFLSAIGDFNQ